VIVLVINFLTLKTWLQPFHFQQISHPSQTIRKALWYRLWCTRFVSRQLTQGVVYDQHDSRIVHLERFPTSHTWHHQTPTVTPPQSKWGNAAKKTRNIISKSPITAVSILFLLVFFKPDTVARVVHS
jgi:hypothetical protein